MKDYRLNVSANYNLLLKLNQNITHKIDKNTNTTILIKDANKCLLEVLPIQDNKNSNLLSFSAEIDFNKKNLNLPKNLFSITKYPNLEYRLEIKKMHLPIKSPLKIINQQNITLDGKNFLATVFFDGITNLVIENSTTFYSQKISDKKVNSCDILLFESEDVLVFNNICNNTSHIDILTLKEGSIENIKQTDCDIFEHSFEDKTITLLQKKQGILKHGVVQVFNINNNSTNLKEEYAVYLNKDGNTVIKNKPLMPIAFLECINAKNFSLAKSYLSEDLKEKISNAHLKEFFGDFKKIEPESLDENNCRVNLIYKEDTIDIAKSFTLTIKDKKIYNISDS